MDAIGSRLQQQYERWQPRARYKTLLDPTVSLVKKLCGSLRRQAKGERILFHYNGHGVPRPTSNGEIWMFNKNFTQYIPMSVYDLVGWARRPAIFVFDCSAAGILLPHFQKMADVTQRAEQQQQQKAGLKRSQHQDSEKLLHSSLTQAQLYKDVRLQRENMQRQKEQTQENGELKEEEHFKSANFKRQHSRQKYLNAENLYQQKYNQQHKQSRQRSSRSRKSRRAKREDDLKSRNPSSNNERRSTSNSSTRTNGRHSSRRGRSRECIILAACGANETLPVNPGVPADLFTACLTTPIKMALHWFLSRNPLCLDIDRKLIDRIPGSLSDRKTPFGELNWIFTSITDTIAWNVLPLPLFQRLFRQDLLLASLFRNFLLAERIMGSLHCTPVSRPALPSTLSHPLWQSWDLAVEQCLAQLPGMLTPSPHRSLGEGFGFPTGSNHRHDDENGIDQSTKEGGRRRKGKRKNLAAASETNNLTAKAQMSKKKVSRKNEVHEDQRSLKDAKREVNEKKENVKDSKTIRNAERQEKVKGKGVSDEKRHDGIRSQNENSADRKRDKFCKSPSSKTQLSVEAAAAFKHSSFFEEQLTAFQVWLRFGDSRHKVPEQLPIVLQVLLSQVHRVRALQLLAEFLDLGRWAVNLALSVGIHPYVLKLLHSPANELRPILVFIWARILDLDLSCQDDLLKNAGHKYFISQLQMREDGPEFATTLSSAAYSRGMASPVPPPLSAIGMIYKQEKWLAAYVLALLMHRNKVGQQQCLRARLHLVAAANLQSEDAMLRQWLCLALAKLWHNFDEARVLASTEQTVDQLFPLLEDKVPEVRGAAAFAIGELLGCSNLDATDVTSEAVGYGDSRRADLLLATKLLPRYNDCSMVAREEMLLALAKLIVDPRHSPFIQAVAQALSEEKRRQKEVLELKRGRIGGRGGMRNRSSMSSKYKSKRSKGDDDIVNEGDESTIGNTKEGSTNAAKEENETNSLHEMSPKASASGWGAQILARLQAAMGDMADTAAAYLAIWQVVRDMHRRDPAPAVQRVAAALVRHVNIKMVEGSGFVARGGLPSTANLSPSVAHTSARDLSSIKGSAIGMKKVQSMDFTALKKAAEKTVTGSVKVLKERPLSLDKERSRKKTDGDDNLAEKVLRSSVVKSVDFRREVAASLHELQLHSTIFEWSMARFARPLLSPATKEADPISREGAALRYRRRRRARVMAMADDIPECKKFVQSAILDNESEMSSVLLFHPYETCLVVANVKDEIHLWNYEEGEKMGAFSNMNRTPSRVTAMHWANANDDALLLVGSDDGMVRCWYHPCGDISLVSAFAAVPDLVPGKRGSGLVLEWQQQHGMLLATGNSTLLRMWDLETERCVCTVPTLTDNCITSMTSWPNGATIAASCGDGSIRIIDKRSRTECAVTAAMREHEHWIVSVTKQRVLASGSHKQFIRVFKTNGDTISTIRYHDGFLGQRIGPV
eukprot:g7823.t1